MRPILLLVLAMTLSPATAAEIALAPDGAPCAITLDGPIEAGDADRLAALIPEAERGLSGGAGTAEAQVRRRVCLESPGGVLTEGVALANLLRRHVFGTIVQRDGTCLSACAVAFMGGTAYDDPTVPPFPDRVMHPTARLGFHAPALSVPKGRYGPADVSDAYATALGSMAILLRDLDKLDFQLSLAALMLDTPPETFSEITTVAQATRLGIAVAPIKAPAELTPILANLACSHAQSYALDAPFAYLDFVTEVEPDQDGRRSQMQQPLYYGDDGLSGCDLWYWPAGDGESYTHLPTSFAGRIELMTGAPPLTLAMLWPPQMALRDLALADDAMPEEASAEVVTTRTEASALCLRFDATPAQIGSGPCSVTETERWTAAGDYSRDRVVVQDGQDLLHLAETITLAADGSETTVETIDGAPALQNWDDDGAGSAYRDRLYDLTEASATAFGEPATDCWPTGASGALCTIREF